MTSQYEQCVKATEDPKFKVIFWTHSITFLLVFFQSLFFRNFALTAARTRRLGQKKEVGEARTPLETEREEEEEGQR